MKPLHRCLFGLSAALVSATASAAINEGIWADDWLGGYGAWLPLGLVVIIYLVVWFARRTRK